MNSISLIQRLHQHRSWSNGKLLAACQAMSVEQLLQPFEIGQGSIWHSLLHMYAAEFVWLAALHGEPEAAAPGDLPNKLPGNQEGEFPIATLDKLVQHWKILEERWSKYLHELDAELLGEIVYRRNFGTPRADILLHVCTHAHYTTAQVVNMLRQCKCEVLPEVMLITLSRQEVHQTRSAL